MRKWNRNRRGRRKPPGGGEPGQEQQPPERQQPAPEETTFPVQGEPAQDPQRDDAAGGRMPRPSRGGRGRRRRKRPGATAPGKPAPGFDPIIPAYTATEGPRAPAHVSLKPGAPTGEAAELAAPEPAPMPSARPAPQPAPRHAPKGAVILSVGLPGSGKTTWFKRKGVTPLSSDLLRSLLFDDATEQGHQDLVFSSLRYLLRARMMARMPMNYVDATNLSPKERRHWIRMAREFGYEVHAVYFDVSLETCLERNRKRQRIVPEDVMQRMAAKLRPPTFEEGFAKIIVVRVKHHPGEAGHEEHEAAADTQAATQPPDPSEFVDEEE